MSGSSTSTQEALKDLTAIARDTVWTAREEPWYDVNPMQGKRQCAVRCERQFGHDVIMLCQPPWSLIAGNGVNA